MYRRRRNSVASLGEKPLQDTRTLDRSLQLMRRLSGGNNCTSSAQIVQSLVESFHAAVHRPSL
jgi:hypothetical protein